jgi:double-stranded uracil-DNA glycosylase
MSHASGLPPVVDAAARVLVLGSLPSHRSIAAREYYAHPQNAFWRIMGRLFGAAPELPYEARTALLGNYGVALWDVLASSLRPGSMDSAIDITTARANELAPFLAAHGSIRLVCFNGKTAAGMFENLVMPAPGKLRADLHYVTLPSTSSANASMSFEEKLKKWSIVSAGWPD